MKSILPVLPVFVLISVLQSCPVGAQDAEQSTSSMKAGVTVNVDNQPLRLVRPGAALRSSAASAAWQSSPQPAPALKALTPQYDSFIDAQAFKTSAKSTNLKGSVQATAKATKLRAGDSSNAQNDMRLQARTGAGTDLAAPQNPSLNSQLAAEAMAKLTHVFSTGATSTAPPAIASGPGAPYIWVQGVVGYYDASHTTPAIVTADQLYRYGGKFADGTPVPSAPIASLNSTGHAYHKGSLATDSFWYKK
jgi:hypothetical protein